MGRPVGNLPEFMPLDNSLNADIKRLHDKYCVVADRNRVCYNKDSTGKHGGARTKGNSEDRQWLDARALSVKMKK